MQKKHFLIVSIFALLLAILLPEIAHAETLGQVIADASSPAAQTWRFFRSIVNYVLVIVLIAAAFSTTLRINIDTYGVKKILPTAILAFILANFSFAIGRTVIDIAEVLSSPQTLNQISDLDNSGSLTHAGKLGYQIVKMFVLSGSSGGDGTVVSTIMHALKGSLTTIIGLLILLPTILVPIVAFGALYLILVVRFYFVQLLIAVAPVAFILLAHPATSKYFSKWWGYFATWVFLQPIAFFILAIGSRIADADNPIVSGGALSGFVQFFLAMGAVTASVLVPFKLGGWVLAGLAKVAGNLWGNVGGGTRAAIAGYGQKTEGTKNIFGSAARAFTKVAYGKQAIQLAMEKQKKKGEEAGLEIALRATGASREADILKLKRVSEKQEENVKGKTTGAITDYVLESAKKDDLDGIIAGLKEAHESEKAVYVLQAIDKHLKALDAKGAKGNKKSIEEAKDLRIKLFGKDEKGKLIGGESTDQALAMARLMGAKIDEEKDAGGNLLKAKIVGGSAFSGKMMDLFSSLNVRGNEFQGSGLVEKVDGDWVFRGNEEQSDYALDRMAEQDAQTMFSRAKDNNWFKGTGEFDDDGKEIMVLQDHILKGMRRNKAITGESLNNHGNRMAPSVQSTGRETQNSAAIQAQLKKEIADAEAKIAQKIDVEKNKQAIQNFRTYAKYFETTGSLDAAKEEFASAKGTSPTAASSSTATPSPIPVSTASGTINIETVPFGTPS